MLKSPEGDCLAAGKLSFSSPQVIVKMHKIAQSTGQRAMMGQLSNGKRLFGRVFKPTSAFVSELKSNDAVRIGELPISTPPLPTP